MAALADDEALTHCCWVLAYVTGTEAGAEALAHSPALLQQLVGWLRCACGVVVGEGSEPKFRLLPVHNEILSGLDGMAASVPGPSVPPIIHTARFLCPQSTQPPIPACPPRVGPCSLSAWRPGFGRALHSVPPTNTLPPPPLPPYPPAATAARPLRPAAARPCL